MNSIRIARISALLLIVLIGVGGFGANSHRPRTDQIDVRYTPPRDASHAPLAEALRAGRTLEKVQRFLSPLRLPRRLLVKVESCGEAEAWYEDGAITICYEYLHDLSRAARSSERPSWLGVDDALSGGLLDVVLHEAGHALFDMLQLPLLGSEETAADQFAAYMMLQVGGGQSRGLVRGGALVYEQEMADIKQRPREYARSAFGARTLAGEHLLPSQRRYNLLCLAYGSDTELFADLVSDDLLPKERAEGCETEYRQVEHAWHKLVAPHVDAQLQRRVWSERWVGEFQY